MRYYAQFLELKKTWTDKEWKTIPHEFSEVLGSDGIFILDGRNNLTTMHYDCKCQIERLKNVKSGIIGYRIYRGSNFENENNFCLATWSAKK